MAEITTALLQFIFELILEVIGEAASETIENVFSPSFFNFLNHKLPITASFTNEIITLDISNHKGRNL